MQPQAVPASIVDEPLYRISDEELLELNAVSKWYRFERDADGLLIVTPPTSSETSARNAALTSQVWVWNEAHGHGKVFDSTAVPCRPTRRCAHPTPVGCVAAVGRKCLRKNDRVSRTWLPIS
jgi:Uma2 family endonuclease